MRALRSALAAVAFGLVLPLDADAQIGVPYDDEDFTEYAQAVGEYYGTTVPRAPRWIRSDELPLVYLLANEAGVSPHVVMALRERGWSWIDITYHLGVDPYIFVDRMPYTTGYWRRYNAWELRYLTDRHIIDYVNLLFWADYHRRPVTQIIVIREYVPTWRHYVRYHSPPRTVARGVYVRRSPSRPGGWPRDTPRYAVPRDDSRRSPAARDDRRRDDPPRSAPGTRPAGGVRGSAPEQPPPARRAEERGGPGGARDERGSTREDVRGAPSTRDERSATRRDDGATQGSTAPPARSEATRGGTTRGEPSRGTAAPSSRGESSRGSSAPAARGESSRGNSAPAVRGESSRGESSSRGTATRRPSGDGRGN